MKKQTTVAAYVRVSADDQNDDLQRDTLSRWAQANGVELAWFADALTRKTVDRPGWRRLWSCVEAGKISRIVCWKLDRLGRTASDLARLFEEMLKRCVRFHSLAEGVDLATSAGRLTAHILASVGASETEIRSEQPHAGIEAARRRSGGKCPWGGSQKAASKKLKPEQVEHIHRAKAEGQGVSANARTVGCSRQTAYRVLSWRNDGDNNNGG